MKAGIDLSLLCRGAFYALDSLPFVLRSPDPERCVKVVLPLWFRIQTLEQPIHLKPKTTHLPPRGCSSVALTYFPLFVIIFCFRNTAVSIFLRALGEAFIPPQIESVLCLWPEPRFSPFGRAEPARCRSRAFCPSAPRVVSTPALIKTRGAAGASLEAL